MNRGQFPIDRGYPRPIRFVAGALGLLFALSAATSAEAGTRPAAAPDRTLPTKPAEGWLPNNEWDLSGNYVEACTDRPLCPSLFGSPSEGTVHTKVIALQITRGRWQKTDLGGLNVAIVVEAPSDQPMTTATRTGWSVCRLFVPESADSQQVAGLTRAVGLLLRGAGGPLFDSVEKAPLVLGLTKERGLLEVPDRVTVQLRPAPSINGSSPPT